MRNRNLSALLEEDLTNEKFSTVGGISVPETIDKRNYNHLMKGYHKIDAQGMTNKNQLWYGNSWFRRIVDYVLRKRVPRKVRKASERFEDAVRISEELSPILEKFEKNLKFYKKAYLGLGEKEDKIFDRKDALGEKLRRMRQEYAAIFPEQELSLKQEFGDAFRWTLFLKNKNRKNYSEYAQRASLNIDLLRYLTEGKSSKEARGIFNKLEDPYKLQLLDRDMCAEISFLEKQFKMSKKFLKNHYKHIELADKNISATERKIKDVNNARLDLEYSKQTYGMYAHLQSRTAFG